MIREFDWTPANAETAPEYTPQLLEALAAPLYVYVGVSWLHLDMCFHIADPDDPKHQISFLDEPYTLGMHARLLRLCDRGYACHDEGKRLFFWPAGQLYSIIRQDRQLAVVRDGLTLPAAYRQLSDISHDYGFKQGSRGACSSFGGPNYTLVGQPGQERKVHHFIWPEGMPVIPVADRQPVQLELL